MILSFFGGLFGGIGTVKAQSSPIRINGNLELAAKSDSGSGTVSDPYIISDKVIDGDTYGFCIYIGNTTKHWVLHHNYLYGADDIGTEYAPDCNILLFNVFGGNITNNSVYNANEHGILLSGPTFSPPGCDNINITENWIHDNDKYGLYIDVGSTDCFIQYNNFTDNAGENLNPTQAYDDGSSNTWDNGYSNPYWDMGECGNFWDDHSTTDTNHMQNQNVAGADDIVDTGSTINPYYIDGSANAQDTYPFTYENRWWEPAP
jgi:hypothetical protein